MPVLEPEPSLLGGVDDGVVEERVDGGDALREHDFVMTLNEGHPVVP